MYIQHLFFLFVIIIISDFVFSHHINDKFLIAKTNRVLLPQCEISNCIKCTESKKCDECEKEFAFIEKECVSYDIIPNNKFVDSCEEYNYDYFCIRCKDDCSLKGNKCKCSHDLKIAIIIVICLAFLIALSLILTIFFVKAQKKKKNEISTESNKMIVAVQSTKENLLINICSKCKTEKAVYFLSCGCLICEKDIGKLKFFKNGDILKCDYCNKLIKSVTIIQNKCKLCSGTKNLRYLNNKIAFEICSECYAKYIQNNKIEMKEQINTSNQTTIETS